MTTLQEINNVEGRIAQRMIQLKDLARQYDEMKSAAREYKALEAQIEEERANRRDFLATQDEQRITNITQMYVIAPAAVLGGSAIAGPVRVEIMTKNGDSYTVLLRFLEEHERQALIRNYWDKVPVSIRSLADTPEAALHEYAAGMARGYLRG